MKTLTNISKKVKKAALCLLLAMLLPNLAAKANNLSVTGLTVIDGGGFYVATFTVSWDNSWYASTSPNNWDAVWLFLKYKDCSTTNWQHVALSNVLADHSVSGGVLGIELPANGDGKGIFVRRTATGGPGNIASANVSVKLLTPAFGGGPYNFQVFGIEMVKILAEDFQIGDGASPSTFTSKTVLTTDESGAVPINFFIAGSAALTANYPIGWNAIYAMKYEISQEQYVDFLNTLTYTQQAARTAIAPSSAPTNYAMYNNPTILYRNGIKIKTSGLATTTPAEYACDYDADNVYDETSDGQNIACNYLSWPDLNAYLDWAALRPMTDPEFEKICRGNLARIASEFVWGSSTSITSASGIVNSGMVDEGASTAGNGLANYSTTYPYRVGFAATASTNRITAGATYYGVMNMGDNVYERVVSVVGTGAGSASLFTGSLGTGNLNATGESSRSSTFGGDWPAGTAASCTGFRGGSFNWVSATRVQTSDRSAASTINNTRALDYGGRGVR